MPNSNITTQEIVWGLEHIRDDLNTLNQDRNTVIYAIERLGELDVALRVASRALIAHDIDEEMAGEYEIITDALNH